MEVGAGEAEMPKGVIVGEGRALVAKGGNKSIKGAVGEAANALGGDDGDIDRFGSEGEGGGIPDRVDDDVLNRTEGPVAVATYEEATREGGPKHVGGQPRDGVDVVATEDAQQQLPQSPRVS